MLLWFGGAHLCSVIRYEVGHEIGHKYMIHKSITDKAFQVQKAFAEGLKIYIF